MGVPFSSYKDKDEEAVDKCKEIAAALRFEAALTVQSPDLLEQHGGHYLDALVGAFVARAADQGNTYTPTGPKQLRLAKQEGWIHIPSCGLEKLAAPFVGLSPESPCKTVALLTALMVRSPVEL